MQPFAPDTIEAGKNADERAEDIAYTINHALACTVTDFIDPYVGNLTQKYLGKRVAIGCQHDHAHNHDHCGHDHAHGTLSHWWIGEVIGDFGAVPVTVGLQRFAPGFMNGIRAWLEPVLGPVFRLGARRSAQRWAQQNGLSAMSPACRDKEAEIYEHEVRHLPQALVWTASSVAINLATQKLTGNPGPLWQLAAGKAAGAGISAGLVVGGRAMMPQVARRWDGFTSQKLFLPATKMIGRTFGIDDKAVERMREKEGKLRGASWEERIAQAGHKEGRTDVIL